MFHGKNFHAEKKRQSVRRHIVGRLRFAFAAQDLGILLRREQGLGKTAERLAERHEKIALGEGRTGGAEILLGLMNFDQSGLQNAEQIQQALRIELPAGNHISAGALARSAPNLKQAAQPKLALLRGMLQGRFGGGQIIFDNVAQAPEATGPGRRKIP